MGIPFGLRREAGPAKGSDGLCGPRRSRRWLTSGAEYTLQAGCGGRPGELSLSFDQRAVRPPSATMTALVTLADSAEAT